MGVIRNVEVEVEAALEKLKAKRREEQKKMKDYTKTLEQDLQKLAEYTGTLSMYVLLRSSFGWSGQHTLAI